MNRVNPNTVVIQPVTNPGDYQTGFTLSGSGGGGAIIRHYSAPGANWRFENCVFAPGASTICVQLGEQPLSGLEFRDCTFQNAANTNLFYWADAQNVDHVTYRRCTLSCDYAPIALGTGGTHTLSYLTLENCQCSSVGGPWIKGPGNVIRVSGGAYCSPFSFTIGNSTSTKSPRNTDVLVEDASFTGNNGNHVLMLDGDGVVCRGNTIHTGSSGTAGYGIVCKWGYGYQVYGNTIYAESAVAVGLIAKGVTEAAFLDNLIYATGAGAYCINPYNNNDDGNKKCRNLAVRRNRFVTSGTAYALRVSDADATGFLVFDENAYQLAGSGQSVIFGTTVAADTLANIRAAWLADAAAVAGGWTENEVNRYQGRRPRIACALAG